jgi:membrane protein YqaA with SNARE-associated domain
MSRLIALFQHLTRYIQPLAAALGAPGVALVSFLDSSVLPLPEVVDLLVVASVVQHPSLWLVYGLAATGGSVAGCYALYLVARKGGEAFVRRRLHERHVERGLRLFRRHGMFALVVPSLLPPPTPFKLFILVAGLAEVQSHTFIMALTIGRGFRFLAIAWLAYAYGNQAAAFMRTTLPQVSAWAAFAIVVAAAIAFFWRRRRAA